MSKAIDFLCVVVGFCVAMTMFGVAHWHYYIGRDGAVFWMLNSMMLHAMTWRIAYRRGWDGN